MCFLKPQAWARLISLRHNDEMCSLLLIAKKKKKILEICERTRGWRVREMQGCEVKALLQDEAFKSASEEVRNVACKYKITSEGPWELIRCTVNRLSAELGPTEVA